MVPVADQGEGRVVIDLVPDCSNLIWKRNQSVCVGWELARSRRRYSGSPVLACNRYPVWWTVKEQRGVPTSTLLAALSRKPNLRTRHLRARSREAGYPRNGPCVLYD